MKKANGQYQNKEQDRRLADLEISMDTIKNHISITNSEMGCVKTDVAWLKRFFFIIATASIGGLIASVLNLLEK